MLALLSVSDKSGLDVFAKRLVRLGFEILSTGNTAKFLKDHRIACREVSDYTGFPEIFDGRVKTLHPKIHAGVLARATKEDQKALDDLGATAIDLVVVNLYPFEQTPTVENIDIGGPTLLRAAAKNFERVCVVCDPADYERVVTALERNEVTLDFRRELARKVFQKTAKYEKAIERYFGGENLRYGENPHQKAWFIKGETSLWEKPLQGKELSYNNILDADAGWWLLREFGEDPFASAILKHTTPCGVALSQQSLKEAFEKALGCDPSSAFGGVVALNREVDRLAAEEIGKIFFEIILAPSFSKEALEIFSKKQNLRLLVIRDRALPKEIVRSAGGGELVQEADTSMEDPARWLVKTKRQPSPEEMRALEFAWKVVKHVKSNAIVFASGDQTVGIGAGQMSRVDAVRLASVKLSDSKTLVCASDAFFPFADNIEALAKAGATAVIQPGGSIRDGEVIAAADSHNIAMVFTGVRHFRH